MNDVEQLIIDKLTGQIGKEAEFKLEELIARNQEVEQLWQQMQQVYAMRKAVSFDQSFNAEAAWLAASALNDCVKQLALINHLMPKRPARPLRH